MPFVRATFSLTEVPQFRRLVQLLEDVEGLARVNADPELQDLVDGCREDMAAACPDRREG